MTDNLSSPETKSFNANDVQMANDTIHRAFETYKETRAFIRSIKKQIVDKSMPPWHADPSVGKWKNKPENRIRRQRLPQIKFHLKCS